MVLPSKVYEFLKFVIKLCPWIVTFISGLLMQLDIGDKEIALITFIVGGVGSLATLIVEFCKANHYKVIAQDGTETEIDFEVEAGANE